MQFRFWTALIEFFADGAPCEWTYALVLVHYPAEGNSDPRIEIIGPLTAPSYRGPSERFVEALSDLGQFRREYGLGATVTFAISRAHRCWSAALEPRAPQLREWLGLLGYAESDPEFLRILDYRSDES